MRKILFVVHESKKSGAPLLAYHLIKELIKDEKFNINILLYKNGELDLDFNYLGKLYFYSPPYLSKLNIKSKILRRVLPEEASTFQYHKRLYSSLELESYDIIYFNSLGCQNMIPFLIDYPAKKVIHVHELNSVVTSMDQNIVKNILINSDLIISSYGVVSSFLIDNYNISKERILENSVYLFPDRKQKIDKLNKKPSRKRSFRIGGCGNVEHRKGTDLFVDFGVKLFQSNPNLEIELIWVGNYDTELGKSLIDKVKSIGLQSKIKFVGSTPNPEIFFNELDVFFLSSREEAFGLVGLENAYCENPLITFDIEGDLPKFIKKYNSGTVIPKFEFAKFQRFILKLISDKSLKSELGKNGRLAVVRDFNIIDQSNIIKESLYLL